MRGNIEARVGRSDAEILATVVGRVVAWLTEDVAPQASRVVSSGNGPYSTSTPQSECRRPLTYGWISFTLPATSLSRIDLEDMGDG